MTLLEDLAAVTAADGLFAGFTVRRLCHLLDTLSRHDSMRLHADGRRTNRTQERMLERDFRFTHSLSPLQYKGLLTLYDGNDPQQHWAAMGDSLPELGSEAPPVVERYFQCEFGPECCGKTMRVGDIQAVAHTVGRSFAAKHIKKQCRGACGCTYYLNKKVYPEQLGNQAVKTHTFYPWNTREPEWIASKGGGTIISAALLTSFSIALCTMRVGFGAFADLHSKSVAAAGGSAGLKLHGPKLHQLWEIYGVLKYHNGVGPHRWHPLPGQVLTPRTPRELDVFDTVGEQSGEQSWVGCLHCMADINQRHWPESPYEAHACLDCRKNTPVQGEDFLTQAAAADGCTSTRYFKCAFYKCASQLESLRPLERYCKEHSALHAAKCAFWVADPPCGNNREDNRLTCGDHAAKEDEFNRRNKEATWTAAQRARAEAGEEPEDMKALRAILGRRTSFGSLTISWTCGLIFGIYPLLEAEGLQEVDEGLRYIMPDETRFPTILFYDKACQYQQYLAARGDSAWTGCLLVVDRFHFRGHVGLRCHFMNNPNDITNPLLWSMEGGIPQFLHNSSIAESVNAWVSGFRPIVMRMSKVRSTWLLDNCATLRNELLLCSKLLHRAPTFNR